MMKECKIHGTTRFFKEKQKKMKDGFVWRCRKCSNRNQVKYRSRKKDKLVEEFGGGCQICGYSKCKRALDFHHKDPNSKVYGIARIYGYGEKLRQELEKCILVCKNCHSELESGLITLEDH